MRQIGKQQMTMKNHTVNILDGPGIIGEKDLSKYNMSGKQKIFANIWV